MQITGLLWGAKLLNYVDFPTSEVLGSEATSEQIKDLLDRYGQVLVNPNFKCGVEIEELSKDQIVTIPFDALTGFKGFVVANALDQINAPNVVL